MKVLSQSEIKKLIDVENTEKYGESKEKTKVELSGGINGVFEVLFFLHVSEVLVKNSVKVSIDEKQNKAKASCLCRPD